MSEATIRTAIYNAIEDIGDVGMVYDYGRYVNTWDEFEALFKTMIGTTSQIRGWMISYRGIVEADGSRFERGDKRISRRHRFQIMGVMGIKDSEESEKTFAALAEDVADALDSDTTLHAFGFVSPATVFYDPAPFAGILVHAALINLEVVEFV